MRNKNLFAIVFTIVVFSPLLFACTGTADAPASAVEMYYDALVERDEPRFLSFTCADWEINALLEYDSFRNVSSELVDFECQTVETEDGFAQVQCAGFISASYGEEIREFLMSDRVFTVINEQGEWRMCGYE